MESKQKKVLDAKFFSLDKDSQLKLLELTDKRLEQSRFKYLTIDQIILDVWNGKTNSERREILKHV